MKKIYSLVLMAAVLLIGTNAWAVSTEAEFLAAFGQSGTVTLENDLVITAANASSWNGVWIGAEAENGEAPSIVLDLQGHELTFQAGKNGQKLYPFVISKGSLKVTGGGQILVQNGACSVNKSTNVFTVFGTYNKVNPLGENPFSHLTIDKGVTVSTVNGTVIAIDALYGASTHAATQNLPTKPNYCTNYFTGNYGWAFGVLIEVNGSLMSQGTADSKCYAIKTNGLVAKPGKTPKGQNIRSNVESYFGQYAGSDSIYAPYIHVGGDAHLVSTSNYNTSNKDAASAAVYASGYAQWQIEGKCEGATGVYVSSGEVAISGDAVIKSTADAYISPTGTGHANGQGSAIVVNSRDSYAGGMDVAISGNVEVSSKAGFAIEEAVNTKPVPVAPGSEETIQETKVESISISGGTFTGGTNPATQEAQPAIIVTAVTSSDPDADVVVYGGNVVNGAQVGAEGGLEELTPDTVHTTTVVIDGKSVIVISDGEAPIGDANVAEGHNKNSSVKWTGASETISADLELKELEINEATAQHLTIADGNTLSVGRIILGEKAQIIVEAGAKLIVTGTQGFVATKESNFVLKNEPNKHSMFLFHPSVTSNIHPKATFEMLTNSWRDLTKTPNAQPEVFAVPTHTAITNIACKNVGKYAYIQAYTNGDWENIGFTDDSPFPYAKLNQPFAAYAVTAYRTESEEALTIQLSGELVGNSNAALTADWKWSFFANSYTAEVDLASFLDGLNSSAQNVYPAVYVATVEGNGYWHWRSIDSEKIGDKGVATKLLPMQGFLLNNRGGKVEDNAINYKDMVYDPATDAGAPARRAIANDITSKLYVVVASEEGAQDEVTLRETENTKSVEKYMNADMNIYATTEEKSAIFAAEDLENTYLGFSTLNGGNYTISFTNVQGREFILIDHETGARVNAEEGVTYNFTAAANSVNDYRFEIVSRENAPTAIENTEAVKSAKGIYTLTGQYVGEMNVWNTLPAGVYVVNGEKLVK